MPARCSRRTFLGLAGVGLAAAATTHLARDRRAFADTKPTAIVRRLLILHAGGGMRSTCLFNAAVAPQWNPFGVLSASDVDANGAPLVARGAAWGVGKVLVDPARKPATLASWGGATVPLVSQIADQITVLAAVDHDPSADAGDGNHFSATLRMCTGAPDGRNGVLTLLSKELDGQHPLPPVIVGGSGAIGASVYGIADDTLGRYRPIFVNGPSDFRYARTDAATPDPDYVASLETKLDGAFVGAYPHALDGRAGTFVAVKGLGVKYGKVFTSDALRVSYVPGATLGVLTDKTPLSNTMLAELFAQPMAGGPANGSFDTAWGGPTALGVRMLQLGAPIVAVGVGGWDFHSDEQTGLPKLAASLGRSLAALHFLLTRLVDPDVPGKTYWDTTLVVVTSEFGRDNTSNTADGGQTVGFNRGEGSDHHGTSPSRYQALPVMGGPVAGGRLLAATDDQVTPKGEVITSGALLATMMRAIGVDPGSYFPDAPLTEIYR